MLNLTLERIERQIRNLPVEHVYALGPDNEILFHHTDHLTNQVRFPAQALAQFNVTVVTHNHAVGRSFSLTDVLLARAAELDHLRVVTGRHRYSLKPPLTGWHAVSAEELHHLVAREEALLERILNGEIQRGRLTRQLASMAAPHRLWERIASFGVIRYSAEKW